MNNKDIQRLKISRRLKIIFGVVLIFILLSVFFIGCSYLWEMFNNSTSTVKSLLAILSAVVLFCFEGILLEEVINRYLKRK